MRIILRTFALALVVSALSAARVKADDDQFALAADHYSHERWQQACEVFGKFLEAHPDHSRAMQARFFYGEALAQLNRLEEARGQFAAVLHGDSSGRYARQALYRSGETAYLAGDVSAAQRDLSAFCERYPDDKLCARALPYLATMALETRDAAAAEVLFSQALERHGDGPLNDQCRLGLARARQQLGQRDQARRAYRELADSPGPLADQALLGLGSLENSTGDYQQALATLERLNAQFPESPLGAKARLGRGYALYKLGRHAEAETLLKELTVDPRLKVEAGYWLGLSQKARKEWRAAADTLSAAEQADDRHVLAPACAFQAADALFEDEQLDQAREAFERALNKWPNCTWSDDYLFGQLRVASARAEHQSCVRLADSLAERFPDSPLLASAQLAKARALAAQKEYAEAGAVLEPWLTGPMRGQQVTEGELAEARALVARCHAARGEFAQAAREVSALGAGKSADGLLSQTSLQVAEAAYAAGDFDRAAELFVGLAHRGLGSAAAWSGLGWCEFRRQHWKESAAAFQQVIDNWRDSPLAAEAALLAGRALEYLDAIEAALARYQVVIDRYPASDRSAEALWRAALASEKLGRSSRSLELLETLIDRYPDFAELDAALYRRGRLLAKAHDDTAADVSFRLLRTKFPNSRYSAESALRLAERACDHARYEEAHDLVTTIDPATAGDSVLERLFYLNGRIALGLGKWDDVEPSLDQLRKRFPQSSLLGAAGYLNAEANFRRGNYAQAATQLAALSSGSTGSEPWSAAAELRRAQSLAQLKEWSDALEVARGIESRFPAFDRQTEADFLIGRCLVAGADFVAAREAFQKVVDRPSAAASETAAMAQWMIGETYFHQEDYARALAAYSSVDDRYPFPSWRAAGLLQAGKCQELLGRWRDAVELYSQLLTLYPDSELAAEARQRRSAAEDHLAGDSPKLK